MSVANAQIKAALIALDGAIKRSDGAELVRCLGELDALALKHDAELDGRLAHFLSRRSYPKALALLQSLETGDRPVAT